jgi:hypothetical protein
MRQSHIDCDEAIMQSEGKETTLAKGSCWLVMRQSHIDCDEAIPSPPSPYRQSEGKEQHYKHMHLVYEK